MKRLPTFLHSPFLRGVFYFLLTIPLVFLAAEGMARSPLGDFLPAPSVQADSFLFDAKVYFLEQRTRREGRLDCLFLGSSVANTGIDPQAVEETYFEKTGERIHCFNFGYPAMNIENAAAFADALIARFAPRLVFYAFIPRDLIDVTYTVDFLEASPWFQTDPSVLDLPDRLLNVTYAYRYYATWRYLLINKNRAKRLEELRSLTDKGFQPAIGRRDPYPETLYLSIENLIQIREEAGPSQTLHSLLRRQRENTRFILLEGPIYRAPQPEYAGLWKAYEAIYIPAIQTIADEEDIPYWRTVETTLLLPERAWYDYFHLNAEGAAVFSQWLGEMLAENAWLFK